MVKEFKTKKMLLYIGVPTMVNLYWLDISDFDVKINH